MASWSSGGLKTLFRLQRTIIALLFLSFLCGMVLGISLVTNTDLSTGILGLLRSERQGPPGHASRLSTTLNPKSTHSKLSSLQSKRHLRRQDNKNLTQLPLRKPEVDENKLYFDVDVSNSSESEKFPEPSYNVHIFYYPWYGTPKVDGSWLHWNHQYLAHWDKREAAKWPTGQHQPPDDIGSSFYPELGPYSSRDPMVLENHMKQIRAAGVGVLAVSWYPPNQADEQGKPSDDFLPTLFDKAADYKLKVCLHIEPYKDRNQKTVRENIKYIIGRYGNHPALYRYTYHGRSLPLYYIYDSYLTLQEDWAMVFKPDGAYTVRYTELDGIFIGLVVEEKHKRSLISAGFDGFYTYFASDGFTYGSSTRNWPVLGSFALTNDAIFIPSIGPGYDDQRVRPWNSRNNKDREQGGYYEQSFKSALLAKPSIVSITSFNEWHEGTQIERAVPKKTSDYQYVDYAPNQPDYYLMLTRKWVHKFKRHQVD